jgi:DNA-binding MarR family transcriptional regulator
MTDQRPIGVWLQLVDRLITEQFAATLDEHGVTRRQWQLLNVLQRGPASVEQLDAAVAPFLDPDATESSADHLSELIESGWVDATPSAYELTERGRVAFDRLSVVVQANREKAGEGLSADEYENTLATLEKLARNLGWSD